MNEQMQLSEHAQYAVELAKDEAKRLGFNFVGTEHMLLGVARESRGLGATTLEFLGASLDRLREEVERVTGRGTWDGSGEIDLTPRTRRIVFQSAAEESDRMATALKEHFERGDDDILAYQYMFLLESRNSEAHRMFVTDNRNCRVKINVRPLCADDVEYFLEGHKVISTGHVLIALYREKDGVAHQILKNLGIRFTKRVQPGAPALADNP